MLSNKTRIHDKAANLNAKPRVQSKPIADDISFASSVDSERGVLMQVAFKQHEISIRSSSSSVQFEHAS